MFLEFILIKNQFQKHKNQNIPIHFLIFFIFQFCLWNWKMKNEKLPKFALFFNQKTNYTFGTWINNPCMESIIQKINFLKNKNYIFSFFKFWNMDLNFLFLFFFEIQILISIWVSIKIETKFEFMEFDCDVKELLSGW